MEVSLGLPRRHCKIWEDVRRSEGGNRPKVHFAEEKEEVKDRKSESSVRSSSEHVRPNMEAACSARP